MGLGQFLPKKKLKKDKKNYRLLFGNYRHNYRHAKRAINKKSSDMLRSDKI